MNTRWRPLVIVMQTRVADQPAFILHRRDWQNSSLLLDILSRDYGRVNLIAKGGKSSHSRSLLQPFSKILLSWSGRQTLKTLTAIDGKPTTLEESLYLPLLYINELLEAFLPELEANPEIFTLYETLLAGIERDNREKFLCEFERAVMQILGYLPDTGTDYEQQKPINVKSWYQFQASRGFILCDTSDMNAIEGRYIDLWNQGNYTERQVIHLAKTIMHCIIDYNLQGKRLKSRDIYSQIKNWG